MSNLSDYLMSILTIMENNVYPALYGDAIYQLTPTIIRRYPNANEREFLINKRMASCRMFIEHRFGRLKSVFKLLGTSRVIHIDDYATKLTFATFIMFNCHTCLRAAGTYFDITPPSIEEYLPLDEDFPPAPEVVLPDFYQHGRN